MSRCPKRRCSRLLRDASFATRVDTRDATCFYAAARPRLSSSRFLPSDRRRASTKFTNRYHTDRKTPLFFQNIYAFGNRRFRRAMLSLALPSRLAARQLQVTRSVSPARRQTGYRRFHAHAPFSSPTPQPATMRRSARHIQPALPRPVRCRRRIAACSSSTEIFCAATPFIQRPLRADAPCRCAKRKRPCFQPAAEMIAAPIAARASAKTAVNPRTRRWPRLRYAPR